MFACDESLFVLWDCNPEYQSSRVENQNHRAFANAIRWLNSDAPRNLNRKLVGQFDPFEKFPSTIELIRMDEKRLVSRHRNAIQKFECLLVGVFCTVAIPLKPNRCMVFPLDGFL